ncbi:MAG: hypothetical protein IMW91_09380 [Firmicutes bacterium]|nr:hypothetical protein [Bacillota bacterium]
MQEKQNAMQITAYHRLGAEIGMQHLTDAFYQCIQYYPELDSYFQGTPAEKSSISRLFTFLLGGPRHYSNQQLAHVHRKRQIGSAQWNAVVAVIEDLLLEAGLSQQEVSHLLQEASRYQSQVVTS